MKIDSITATIETRGNGEIVISSPSLGSLYPSADEVRTFRDALTAALGEDIKDVTPEEGITQADGEDLKALFSGDRDTVTTALRVAEQALTLANRSL